MRLSKLVVAALLFAAAGQASATCRWSKPASHATHWLAGMVQADGRFTYRLDEAGWPKPGYNILRHAGAVLALSEAAAHPALDQHTQALAKSAADQASRYLADCCLRPLPGWSAVSAVWPAPRPGQARRPRREAKLGAAGLALAAWFAAERAGVFVPALGDRRRLARFIVYMQTPSGRFISKFQARGPHAGLDDRWQSLYYPGEAALGLLRLAQAEPDPQLAALWRDTATRALTYLAQNRSRSDVYPADHWALIASAELPDLADAASRALLQQHVQGVLQTLRGEAAAHRAGAMDAQAKVALAATRLEAINAALGFLSSGRSDSDLPGLRDNIAAWLASAQHPTGGMPRAVSATTPRWREQRIDYAQHAISGWLGACANARP